MSSKPYVIRISSQKGGVGKTTIAVNLATALSFFGSKVLLIDGDFINPSVAFHMGLEGTNTGVRAVLTGKSTLANATVVHGPTGISVLPGEIKANMHIPTASQFDKLFEQIANTSYNFVILDTPPGSIIEAEEHVKSSGEAIIITTPEISACTSAARLANHYDKIHLKHGLIVNKFKNKRYELHVRGIEEMYDGNILGVFPDDETIPISVAEHIPAYVVDRHAPFSRQMRELANKYITKFGFEYEDNEKEGFFDRLLARIRNIFRGR